VEQQGINGCEEAGLRVHVNLTFSATERLTRVNAYQS